MERKQLYIKYKGKRYKNKSEAIREYCLECCCDSQVEVRECRSYKCPLYMYRMRQNGFHILEDKKENDN